MAKIIRTPWTPGELVVALHVMGGFSPEGGYKYSDKVVAALVAAGYQERTESAVVAQMNRVDLSPQLSSALAEEDTRMPIKEITLQGLTERTD